MTTENPREAKALKVGEIVTPFTLLDSNGESVSLAERSAHSKLFIIFYRGEW